MQANYERFPKLFSTSLNKHLLALTLTHTQTISLLEDLRAMHALWTQLPALEAMVTKHASQWDKNATTIVLVSAASMEAIWQDLNVSTVVVLANALDKAVEEMDTVNVTNCMQALSWLSRELEPEVPELEALEAAAGEQERQEEDQHPEHQQDQQEKQQDQKEAASPPPPPLEAAPEQDQRALEEHKKKLPLVLQMATALVRKFQSHPADYSADQYDDMSMFFDLLHRMGWMELMGSGPVPVSSGQSWQEEQGSEEEDEDDGYADDLEDDEEYEQDGEYEEGDEEEDEYDGSVEHLNTRKVLEEYEEDREEDGRDDGEEGEDGDYYEEEE